MASTKISRKQLLKEPDEFLSFSAKTLAFVAENRQRIAIGAGALVALVLILVGAHVITERNRLKASDMLYAAMASYQQVVTADGPEKGYAAVVDQYRQLLAEHGGSDAGKLARVVFAGHCLAADQYDEAIELYRAAIAETDGSPLLRSSLFAGLGHAHAGKAQWSEAVTAYETAMDSAATGTGGDILFELGQVYEQLGQADKSREAFERLIADFPDTIYAGMAREKVGGVPKKNEG